MLTPDYLAGLPDSLVKLYAEAEETILADMARRISTYDDWIPAAEWQRRKLLDMGAVDEMILKELSQRTGQSQKELERLMGEAGKKAAAYDNELYTAHGLNPPKLGDSERMQRVLRAGLVQTNGLFKNLTATTANTATKQFEDALDLTWLEINSGAFDANTAVRSAVKRLARDGVGAVRYPTGHVDTLEVAVRRAVVTGVNQTALKLQDALADEMGSDLVEVTAHAGARPNHAAWQGGIYSRSGESKAYKGLVEATGYGTGAGLGGWNCRHSMNPWFEGDPKAYKPEMLKKYDEPAYTYNDQELTEYEASQQQRYLERQIRRWKREETAMKAAGLPTDEAAAKVAQWQEKQRDFIRQTGLKRQGDREQVAKTGHRGILKDTELKLHKITPEAIERVPVVTGGILNEAQAKRLQEYHKELLRFVEHDPPGTEAVQYLDMDMNLLTRYKGGMNRVRPSSFLEPHIATHNHPDGLTFSPSDIENFIYDGDLIVMTVVGNNGTVYLLSKLDSYDAAGFIRHLTVTKSKHQNRMDSLENYFKYIDDCFKEVEKYGVRFEQGGT